MAGALGGNVFGEAVALWSPFWYGGERYDANRLQVREDDEAEAYQYAEDRKRCPQCRHVTVDIKLASISSTGWMAKCAQNCGHRWEYPAPMRQATETAERTARIASVIRRGKRGHGQKLYKYDQRLYRKRRDLKNPHAP